MEDRDDAAELGPDRGRDRGAPGVDAGRLRTAGGERMGLIDRWRSFVGAAPLEREILPYSFNDWLSSFGYAGNTYTFPTYGGTLTQTAEEVPKTYEGYATKAFRGNNVVFACATTRQMLFSEARFAFRDVSSGHPGDIMVPTDGRNRGTGELSVLREPWPGGTTGDLLSRMEQDVTLSGSSYIHRAGRQLVRLRPDWVTIIYSGYPWDLDAEVIGYGYEPGGPSGGQDPIRLDREAVTQYAPIPDPMSPWRGMSWIDAALREIGADSAATTHKSSLYERGGTPNMIVSFDATVRKELFDAYVKIIR